MQYQKDKSRSEQDLLNGLNLHNSNILDVSIDGQMRRSVSGSQIERFAESIPEVNFIKLVKMFNKIFLGKRRARRRCSFKKRLHELFRRKNSRLD